MTYYKIELADDETKLITQNELNNSIQSAEEFDGFLGFSILDKKELCNNCPSITICFIHGCPPADQSG